MIELACEDIDSAMELIEELDGQTEITARLTTAQPKPVSTFPKSIPGRAAHLGPAAITTIVVSAASITSALISLATAIVNWKNSRAKKSGDTEVVILILNGTTTLPIPDISDPAILAQQLLELKTNHIRITHALSPTNPKRSKKKRG